jgi:hypothetical protein
MVDLFIGNDNRRGSCFVDHIVQAVRIAECLYGLAWAYSMNHHRAIYGLGIHICIYALQA